MGFEKDRGCRLVLELPMDDVSYRVYRVKVAGRLDG